MVVDGDHRPSPGTSERTARTILRIKGACLPGQRAVKQNPGQRTTHIRLYPVTVPGRKRQKPRRSILSVRRPPRSLTPCLRSGIYSNRRKRSGMEQNSDEALQRHTLCWLESAGTAAGARQLNGAFSAPPASWREELQDYLLSGYLPASCAGHS